MTRTPPAQRPFAYEPYTAPILARMNELLLPHWDADGRRGPLASADPDALDEFVLALPLDAQLAVREDMRGLVEHWISRKMKELADNLQAASTESRIAQFARPGVEIVLNGTTPTPYGRQLSPYNIWIMKLLMDLPAVSYRQGRIDTVDRRTDNRFDVTFDSGEVETYDRVVSRYGPKPRSSSIAIGHPRNTQEGDWLLWYEKVPTADSLNPNGPRTVLYPPRAAIVDAEDRLMSRIRSDDVIYRHQYIGRIWLGLTDAHRGNPIYDDAQAWLAGQLAAGIHPRYDGDNDIDRHNRLG